MTHSRKYRPDRFLSVWVKIVEMIACVTAGGIQKKKKMLLHARMHRHYVYAGKQY